MDPDIEEMPTDYIAWLDFRVMKTTKGQYADYSTSNGHVKELPLTNEMAAVDQRFDHNLADFLPKKPDAELTS